MAYLIATLDQMPTVLAGATPHATALEFRGQTTSWRELEAASVKVASRLIDGGIDKSDRVAFLGRNSDFYFKVLFGTARAGAIFVPVNWRLAELEIAYALTDCTPKILFVSPEFLPKILNLEEKLSENLTIILVDPAGGGDFIHFDQWLADSAGQERELGSGKEDDTVFLLYTSGTTGYPKAAELTNRYFINALHAFLDGPEPAYRIHPHEVALVTMPLFHVGGLLYVYTVLAQGASVILLEDFDPGEVLRFVSERLIPFIPTVPTIVSALLDHPSAKETNFENLRYILYGAAPMPPALLSRAMDVMTCEFAQYYGMTESVAVTCLPPNAHDRQGNEKMLSVGQALPGVKIRIVDSAGQLAPAGEIGEIEVLSGVLLKGYWKLPELTASAFHDGWFRTGDAGYLDEDGFLYIRDRIKDMIISGGENIYPAEVENALYSHPGIKEAAVVGVPDAKWGEIPKAFVVMEEGFAFEAEELRSFLAGRIARYKLPRLYENIDVLPRNAAGKLLKRELRERRSNE